MIIPARQPGEPANAAICDLMGLAYQRIKTEEDEVNWTNRITVPLQDLIGRFDESTVFQRFPWTDDNKWLLRGPYYGEETYKHLKNGFLGLQWKYNDAGLGLPRSCSMRQNVSSSAAGPNRSLTSGWLCA